MDRDVHLFQKLLKRLPTHRVRQITYAFYDKRDKQLRKLVAAEAQRLTGVENIRCQDIEWHATRNCGCLHCIDESGDPYRWNEIRLLFYDSISIIISYTTLHCDISINVDKSYELEDSENAECIERVYAAVTEDVKHFLQIFTGLSLMFVTRTKYKINKNSPVCRLLRYCDHIHQSRFVDPTVYICYEMLAIHKYRPHSLVAKLPKDVLKIILLMLLR